MEEKNLAIDRSRVLRRRSASRTAERLGIGCWITLQDDAVPPLAANNAITHHDRTVGLICFSCGQVARSTSMHQPSSVRRLHDRRLRIRGIRSQHRRERRERKRVGQAAPSAAPCLPRTRPWPYSLRAEARRAVSNHRTNLECPAQLCAAIPRLDRWSWTSVEGPKVRCEDHVLSLPSHYGFDSLVGDCPVPVTTPS